jgi:ABC-type Na+ efflux pump, permease component
MNKLWLIFKREYFTRVKKKSFIIITLLTPLIFSLFVLIPIWIESYESDDAHRVAVIDDGQLLKGILKDENNLHFHFEDTPLEELKGQLESKNYDGILLIPTLKNLKEYKHTVYYYSDRQLGFDLRLGIEGKVSRGIRDYKIVAMGFDKENLDGLRTKVSLNPEPIDESKKDESSMAAVIAVAMGGIMGGLMYITIFVYGMMVMRSVMEEKTNRIVEIIISSVKPFQLMLGKIIGVGAVALTQIAIWAIMIPSVSFIVQLLFGVKSTSRLETASNNIPIDQEEIGNAMTQVMTELAAQNWLLIIPVFILFFLGGYLLYSSMFAAIGSAMGDELGEGQMLTFPIFIPVIIAFYIMTVVIRAPNSSLAVWSSIFPLFSPIVMPARLAFDPPLWQVGLSIISLLATALFFVWLSGRIYRVGILMYGKKITFKELAKWMFYKS